MWIFNFVLIVPQAIPNLLALQLMGCRTTRRGVRRRSEVTVTDIYMYIGFLEIYCEYNVLVLSRTRL